MKERFSKSKILIADIGVTIICLGILFFPYLMGRKYFLFYNVVGDGVAQFYPQYHQAAEIFEKGQGLASYLFSSGWGSAVGVRKLLDIFIVTGGVAQIPYRMGIAVMLKVFFSGTAFSAYLLTLEKNKETCIIGGLVYGFSAQVLIGGIWKNQGELAIILALLLLVIERWKKVRDIWNALLTGLALVLFCTQISLYFQLVYGCVVIGYVLMNLWLEHKPKQLELEEKKKRKAIFLIGGIVLLILLAAIVLAIYPKLSTILHSYRVQNGMSQWKSEWHDTFTVDNIKECITVYLRTLCPTILGIGGVEPWYGEGPGAYCEAGSLYCGLLMLLMVPQGYGKEKKRNILYTLLLCGVGILIFFPAIRLAANGFANTYFKLTRMIGIIVIIWIAVLALHDILSDKKRLKLKRLWGSTVLLIMPMVILSLWKYRGKIYLQDMALVSIVLILYAVILTVYKKCEKCSTYCKGVLVVLVAVEAVTLNYRFINNTDAITPEAWEHGYYQDGTPEAVDTIKSMDSDFYRIEKAYRSGLLNDAGAQGYRGTTYYMGGVPAQEQTDLMVNIGMPSLWNQRGYCGGTYGNAAAEALFANRYVLAGYENCISHNYQKIGNTGNINVFENKNALPLGFVYDAVMPKSDFERYELPERREAILQGCVVEDDSTLLNTLEKVEAINTLEANPIWSMEMENYEIGTGLNIEPIQENETLVVEVENTEEACVNVVWSTPEEAWTANRERVVSIYKEFGKNQLALDNQVGTSMLVVQSFSVKEVTKVDKVSIKVYNTEEYYKTYEQSMSKLGTQVLQVQEVSDIYIKGKIFVDARKLLHLSIPYNKNWHYMVDGSEVKPERVNYVFTGIILEPGEHEIEMIYEK